jgi:hypothetical protein
MSDTREDQPVEPEKSVENSDPDSSTTASDKPWLFQPGEDPRRGKGCEPGAPNAGRPRKAYVDWCREVLRDPKVEKAVEGVLKSGKHRHFAQMYRTISDRAHGKPVQPLSAPDGGALIPKDIRVTLVKPDDSASA